ncbi:hypothetical protein [Dongia deserti]|uniref:hypothetical protein n=1 Tax=Dongia deserti TaxID=2268030 RepID=UPI0013C4C182|nr:hypothetical protein [Dongia deserti]
MPDTDSDTAASGMSLRRSSLSCVAIEPVLPLSAAGTGARSVADGVTRPVVVRTRAGDCFKLGGGGMARWIEGDAKSGARVSLPAGGADGGTRCGLGASAGRLSAGRGGCALCSANFGMRAGCTGAPRGGCFASPEGGLSEGVVAGVP